MKIVTSLLKIVAGLALVQIAIPAQAADPVAKPVPAAAAKPAPAAAAKAAPAAAPAPPKEDEVENASPDEPLAPAFSLVKAAEFLDSIAVGWTREHRCGTCHTNYPYIMARSALLDIPGTAYPEVRGFFEKQLTDRDPKKTKGISSDLVESAAVLAFADAQTTGKLSDAARAAFDQMWQLQRPDGAWKWAKCDWPPAESDDEYGAHMAAIAVSVAPDKYGTSEAAQAGVKKLQDYLHKNAPAGLHNRAMGLWAASHMDGFLTKKEKQDVVKALLAVQRPDGGWNLPSLGSYVRHDGSPNDPNVPSDGYGTGFVVYILRQAGIPAANPQIKKGIAWLKGHQRVSGRWFTRSLSEDDEHYISNIGTAYAVLALKACEKPGVKKPAAKNTASRAGG